MASNLKADVIVLQMRHGYEGKLAELHVRSNQKDGIKLDIKIMLLGDKQSGKSTLVFLTIRKEEKLLDRSFDFWPA